MSHYKNTLLTVALLLASSVTFGQTHNEWFCQATDFNDRSALFDFDLKYFSHGRSPHANVTTDNGDFFKGSYGTRIILGGTRLDGFREFTLTAYGASGIFDLDLTAGDHSRKFGHGSIENNGQILSFGVSCTLISGDVTEL